MPNKRPQPIIDWVTEYDNISFVPNADRFFDQYQASAETFRQKILLQKQERQIQQEQQSSSISVDHRLDGGFNYAVEMKINVNYGVSENTIEDDGSNDCGDDRQNQEVLKSSSMSTIPSRLTPLRSRQRYDILTPIIGCNNAQQQHMKKIGIFVFVHGGYWYKMDKSWFTHVADVPLSKGYQVLIPGYTLCPDVCVSDISKEITQFLCHLHDCSHRNNDDDDGGCQIWKDCPIVLCGHSAGGHLVTRQLCEDLAKYIPRDLLRRITNIISLSGVHDLRPILRVTNHNEFIKLDDDEARRESPALAIPVKVELEAAQLMTDGDDEEGSGVSDRNRRRHQVVTCMVGCDERPEFIRQTDLLGNIWKGMGIATETIHLPNKHHFNIIDEITDPSSTLWNHVLQ